jgi:hypothetical protein
MLNLSFLVFLVVPQVYRRVMDPVSFKVLIRALSLAYFSVRLLVKIRELIRVLLLALLLVSTQASLRVLADPSSISIFRPSLPPRSVPIFEPSFDPIGALSSVPSSEPSSIPRSINHYQVVTTNDISYSY